MAIGRALVTHPTVLLLDEPLAALDAKLREEMQIELINLQKEVGITFVYVTHDQTEALALSHRIAVMNKGRVEQIDEPSRLYSFPASRFVADFIGTCNLLEGSIASNADGIVAIEVAGLGTVRVAAAPPAAALAAGTIALRPEKIRVQAAAAQPRRPIARQSLPRHRHRIPLPRRRDRLHRHHARRPQARDAARQFGRGTHEVLRSRRCGRDELAGRRRPLHRPTDRSELDDDLIR